jgi:hypothetical protein
MLISVLVAQGKPDHACEVTYEVPDTTHSLGSYLVVQQLEQLDQTLAQYERSREVATFRERLRDVLRELRWLAQWLPSASSRTDVTTL